MNKEEYKTYRHNYYLKNKKRISIVSKKYRENHKEEIKEQSKQYYQNNKKEMNKKQREYAKNHPEDVFKRHEKFYQKSKKTIQILKINGCAICGYDKCDKALDFHHVNPKEKCFRITRRNAHNINIIEELNKCILLCSNCHREIHR